MYDRTNYPLVDLLGAEGGIRRSTTRAALEIRTPATAADLRYRVHYRVRNSVPARYTPVVPGLQIMLICRAFAGRTPLRASARAADSTSEPLRRL